jgi:hypothetical protein
VAENVSTIFWSGASFYAAFPTSTGTLCRLSIALKTRTPLIGFWTTCAGRNTMPMFGSSWRHPPEPHLARCLFSRERNPRYHSSISRAAAEHLVGMDSCGYRQINFFRSDESSLRSQVTALLHSVNAPILRSRSCWAPILCLPKLNGLDTAACTPTNRWVCRWTSATSPSWSTARHR